MEETKLKLNFPSETGRPTAGTNAKESDENTAKEAVKPSESKEEPVPLTVGQCSGKTDPAMSEERIKELQAGVSAAKTCQKSEAKEEKAAAKNAKDQKKMTASKAKAKNGKGAKKRKVQEEDEESNPLDSEESLTDEYEDLPSDDEASKDGKEAAAESKASFPIVGNCSMIGPNDKWFSNDQLNRPTS